MVKNQAVAMPVPALTPEKQPASNADPYGSEALVAQLRAGSREAKAVFFDRYSDYVLGILVRILGSDPELQDTLQDVFVEAYASIHRLKEPRALTNWLTQVAVQTARKHIRNKRRRRLFVLLRFDGLPEMPTEAVSFEVGDALRATYAVLSQMNA